MSRSDFDQEYTRASAGKSWFRLEDLLKMPRAPPVYRVPTVLEPPRAPSPRAPAPPCTVLTRVTVTPLSSQPSAMLATVRTLETIPGAGFKADPLDDGGVITGTATNASLLKWAAERQGYVSSVTFGWPKTDVDRATPRKPSRSRR